MVKVLGLLNNIGHGPQSGKTFCNQGGGVVLVSKLAAVIEKKAAKLSRSCHINKSWCRLFDKEITLPERVRIDLDRKLIALL